MMIFLFISVGVLGGGLVFGLVSFHKLAGALC